MRPTRRASTGSIIGKPQYRVHKPCRRDSPAPPLTQQAYLRTTTIMSSPPQVEYRRLGQSGLRVSNPILGAMSLGTSKWAPWVIDEEEVRLAVHSRSRTFVLTSGSTGSAASGGRVEAWSLVRDHSHPSPSAGLTALTFGRTWDTANMYSNGESEVLIGKAIKKVRRGVLLPWS
jgi:hypothetical protein